MLRVFKNLWSLADEITRVHRTEAKIAALVEFLRNSGCPLALKLAQHATGIHERLSERLQRLEDSWRKEESRFEDVMAFYDFDCYDVYSVVREVKTADEELRKVRRELAAISKVCSALRSIPAEKRSAVFSILLMYYQSVEAMLFKKRKMLQTLHSRLYMLYENIFKPECEELVRRALRS